MTMNKRKGRGKVKTNGNLGSNTIEERFKDACKSKIRPNYKQ
jgi:hypothetical protein